MDDRTLKLLEFDRVAEAIAAHAEGDGARARLRESRPIAEPRRRSAEAACLAEAIRRDAEPGSWCAVASGTLTGLIADPERALLDGPELVAVAAWIEAAEDTRAAWQDEAVRARHPGLAALADAIRPPAGLGARLRASLDPDGRVLDAASPALKRVRGELVTAERRLEQRLERWARGFGADAYVTRHGDRFVAMVPAAGFSRRTAIVHDVSGSGSSLFVEPIEACEDNNAMLELRSRAFEEERRVLRELRARVLESGDVLLAAEESLVRLDALRACARWARTHGAVALAPGGPRMHLERARHPLLLEAAHRGEGAPVVPLDLELGATRAGGPVARVLLVSGPNMGGKTVLLKTVGLCALLAHAALPVPCAEGSALPELEVVVADLGDEQSLDRGLSTFAAHLAAMAEMARVAGPAALVLCDEIGSGTDPDEGGALARALLEELAERGAWAVVTTHLGSLKRVAAEVPGVVNGSLEFDPATLRSRFVFVAGVPGASHALEVAGRLGFPERLLARARTLAPESARALERLTVELGEAARRAREEAGAHARARAEAEAAAQAHREAAEHAKLELADKRRALTRESEALLARSRELWQVVQKEARRRDATREDAARLKRDVEDATRAVEALARGPEPAAAATPGLRASDVVPGRRVRETELGVEAEVVSAPDAEGRVQLRRGSWTIQTRLQRLAPAEAREESRPLAGSWTAADGPATLEVDLRGMESDEAIAALDAGLDRAVVSGLGEVRIIHGIGRGVLRAAVERHLKGHPQVAGQRLGQVGEGGRGVTIVRLR